jgi:UDP-N-acetylmuramate--alanine ligase
MQISGLNGLDMGLVHLLGISGAGQYALAEMLLDAGIKLSGSDLSLSETAKSLEQRGVQLFEGHRPENVANATIVVKTAASPEDNPELVEADRRGLKILTNAEMVALLVNSRRCLAIAGTHGKTTTTNLVASLLSKAGLNPTYFIGGVSRDLGRSGGLGEGEFSVVEADEYARRFLEYRPDTAIVTGIEADHLDYYGDFDTLTKAYSEFVSRARRLFFCADQLQARELGEKLRQERQGGVFFYGLDGMADWRATNIEPNALGGHDFSLWQSQRMLARVTLSLPGLHNVQNAVGALAVCITVAPWIEPKVFCGLASEIIGTSRRFEVKGETFVEGVTVVDDYAHHPSEIKATLAAARARYSGRRLVALFQPHTYSRTKALLDEFAESFWEADRVALMEIFPSRETDTLGVASADIVSRMKHPGKLEKVLNHQTARAELKRILQPGDVFMTLGAGDVWKVAEVKE